MNQGLPTEPVEEKVRRIFSTLFGLPVGSISSESSIHTLERWSSLMHLKLVATIEQAFEITFSEEEVLQLTSFKDVVRALESKNISK